MSSVYIHIPYCLSKCRYCDFNSQPLRDQSEADKYCQALVDEIGRRETSSAGLETVYFGGGTPSLLSAGQLSQILLELDKVWGKRSSGCETTLEANPGTADQVKLSALRDAGFNRLSIGVQSFNDDLLKTLGRIHDSQRAQEFYKNARSAGFGNIGLDLIYALPGQKLAVWRDDLRRAADLGPQHLSLYSLTYEDGTDFFRARNEGLLLPCEENLETEMYLWAIEELMGYGYEHYEISNFALPSYRSRHNLNYWTAGDYEGFGAGAHSHREGRRWSNIKDFLSYIRALEEGTDPIENEEKLTPEQRIFEALFLGMRMTEGIDVDRFRKRWGQDPWCGREDLWNKWQNEGLAERRSGKLRFTRRGLMLSDLLLQELAP